MTESIHQLVENLPSSSLTTHVLGALDYLVPGEWKNITVFADLIKDETGEDDDALVQQIGEKAIALWFDESTGYQRAVSIFQMVDHESTVAGAAALADMAANRFEVLSFLKDVTPKADTVQAIDAGVKLVAELAAFCSARGIPGDSIGDFASSLAAYAKEDVMRLSAWLAFDCIIPLGPDFLAKLLAAADSHQEIAEHSIFTRIAEHLPGGVGEKVSLVRSTLEGASGHIESFVASKDMTQDSLLARVRDYVEVADDKLDYVAAALDLGTNTFEHTGIQSVARTLIRRAYGEL